MEQTDQLLASALSRLAPLHREVVMLRDVEGLTAPEAAERLSISVQALKSRLHRARSELRASLLHLQVH
jgi:RNA polymerase sigma-70 factor (ECF subfamily)